MTMTNGNADQVRPARDQDGFEQVPAQEEKTKGRKAALTTMRRLQKGLEARGSAADPLPASCSNS